MDATQQTDDEPPPSWCSICGALFISIAAGICLCSGAIYVGLYLRESPIMEYLKKETTTHTIYTVTELQWGNHISFPTSSSSGVTRHHAVVIAPIDDTHIKIIHSTLHSQYLRTEALIYVETIDISEHLRAGTVLRYEQAESLGTIFWLRSVLQVDPESKAQAVSSATDLEWGDLIFFQTSHALVYHLAQVDAQINNTHVKVLHFIFHNHDAANPVSPGGGFHKDFNSMSSNQASATHTMREAGIYYDVIDISEHLRAGTVGRYFCTREQHLSVKMWRTIHRVKKTTELQRGDHIYYPTRMSLAYHHAIVVAPVNDKNVTVIHFTHVTYKDVLGSTSKIKAGIYEEEIDISKYLKAGTVGRYFYHPEQSLPADTVIARARSRIGESEPYSLWSNNCEHFAHWCKVGLSCSKQSLPVLMWLNFSAWENCFKGPRPMMCEPHVDRFDPIVGASICRFSCSVSYSSVFNSPFCPRCP